MRITIAKIFIILKGRIRLLFQRYFYTIVDKFYRKRLQVSLGDLMLQRGDISQIQFIIASRLLDIENYYQSQKENIRFKYQRAISIHDSGLKYMHDNTFDNNFVSLIDSYEERGYDNNSLLYVDNRFTLENGTHRFAMHLYMNIPYVNVEYHYRKCSHHDNLIPYLKKVFDILPTALIRDVITRYSLIQGWLIEEGMTFVCLVCGKDTTIVSNCIQDLSIMAIILKIKELTFSDNNIKMLFLNNSLGKNLKMVQFRLSDPQYIVKGETYYSKKIKEIESILQERYSSNELQFIISSNCGEGYKLYKRIKKYI